MLNLKFLIQNLAITIPCDASFPKPQDKALPLSYHWIPNPYSSSP